MGHKQDHKKDKDAFESQIGTTGPVLPPGLMSGSGGGSNSSLSSGSGLTEAAGAAMSQWTEAPAPAKAPIDTLTVADRERKMNKKRTDGDVEDKGGDKGGDKGQDAGKEQTVS
jgi:hypothetical protein